ncbi:hypothetical protein GCM10010168_50090 [Actinoplanes ianthinogenes]|uniref:Ricin B lectin domain-containing protein n=1 Tax=Actinoplanes ianthinogenes TaxID=122358 RepID=A0ABN6CM14_9ACTN|nr:ricin-type beta-trefoil lectin domain protein [Actinoplanes ianthinogenes]BCJ46061.1 hypothetical protein Aiant_67180 [Actinoplanes ianthinogenes]GGR25945.1 hypothetical protein GCM10010168_50090 [Actinoplanes ianthinogenes]
MIQLRGDDRGSMPLAMLLSIVGVTLSTLVGSVAVSQITEARTSSDRVQALIAAQAGVNVATAQFRAATDSTGTGDPARLPDGPLAGNVAPNGGARYQVTITYRDLDGNPLAVPLNAQPATAVVVSTGIRAATGPFHQGTAGARTLQATYVFRLSNQNIPGGQIHVRGSVADLCLDAGSAQPAAGTPVQMQSCLGVPAPQIWAYNSDLTISLVSSRTGANPLGMCLDAGSPHAAGAQVKVQKCVATSPPPPQQQWSTNDSANIMGTSNGSTLDNYCFNVQSPNFAGSFVVLSTTKCNGNYDNVQTFQPDAAVGAGAAGPTTRQLVNYQQFGRCLDVTNQNVASTFLIAWPCKQAPNPANISWNQKWTLPAALNGAHTATGRIYTTLSGIDYCLRSPGVTSGAYPTVTTCTSTSYTADQTWTVYGNTGSYTASYQIVDNTGLCLAPADPAAYPAEVLPYIGPPVSRIVLRACDGSAWQKWNAPPDVSEPSPLKQITER